ncbi:MAG: LysR family transcriptional regulator [Burkholderiaceae bacterium]|nr:LysR family transcriptional regulator [Burkholderiaceae bacterium]
MILSLEALAVLDAIARRGSFAAAAAELGKVPSALTYTVRRLEDELDILIFDRRGKRAQLTAAGEELLEQGRLLMRAADDVVCRVEVLASGWRSSCASPWTALVAFERMRPLLADFYRLNAPTRLRFSYEVLDGGWDALLSGRADLAIGVSSETPSAAFASGLYTVRPLGDVRFVYCVAPNHPLAALPEPLEPEVLVHHRAIAVANSARHLPLRSAGLVSGQATLTVATLDQKVAMQVAGIGGGYLPEAFARPYLASGQLVVRQTTRRPEAEVVQYAWRRAARGKAQAWWLGRLDVARVRRQLLAGPLESPAVSERPEPTSEPARLKPSTAPAGAPASALAVRATRRRAAKR